MLYFIPTPIGNLGDISFRTIEVLKDGEYILCEDTRVTKKLLQLLSQNLGINFPDFNFLSVHSHNEQKFLQSRENQEILTNSKCIYVSDAGMPCVSDPGSFLAGFCLDNNIQYDVLPGANAVLTAYASSGFEDSTFTFFGFLPHKGNDRKIKLEKVLGSEHLAILYESPHRLLKLLEELNGTVPQREIFLAKELTKKFQTRYKGSAGELFNILKDEQIKGEWVVVIKPETSLLKGSPITTEDIEELNLPPKQKAKLLSKLTGQNVKDIYNRLIS
jgi:16S rRNA (cytidine1402-2'-O)-methyltransferase